MLKIPAVLLSIVVIALSAVPAGAAMSDKEKGEVATLVASAKVTLEEGLKTSKKSGNPISGKFEIENGKPQLSIYTVKDGNKYSEVVVDHASGEIAKTKAITGGEDLTAAKNQSASLFRATRELREAVREAKRDNPGFNAVSVWPEMKDHHSLATVMLVKGNDWKTTVIDLTVYKTLIKE